MWGTFSNIWKGLHNIHIHIHIHIHTYIHPSIHTYIHTHCIHIIYIYQQIRDGLPLYCHETPAVGQVLDKDQKTIPGLYAIGEARSPAMVGIKSANMSNMGKYSPKLWENPVWTYVRFISWFTTSCAMSTIWVRPVAVFMGTTDWLATRCWNASWQNVGGVDVVTSWSTLLMIFPCLRSPWHYDFHVLWCAL